MTKTREGPSAPLFIFEREVLHMLFKVTRASDWSDEDAEIKEISTLEELVKFQKECDYSLILGNRQALVEEDSVIDLMIYDDYVE